MARLELKVRKVPLVERVMLDLLALLVLSVAPDLP